MMHASGTPDSAPSLATTSRGSTDTEDLTRVLFEELENDTPLKHVSGQVSTPLGTFASSQPAQDSTSAMSDYYEELLATSSSISRSMSDERQDQEPQPVGIQRKENDSPSDVPIKATCSSLNISPGQLANMFTLFQRTQHDEPPYQNFSSAPKPSPISVIIKQEDVEDDAATEVTSNTAPSIVQRMPQLESLHRECEALKQIIRTDAASMLQLKTDLDTLRNDMTNNVSTIQRLQKKLELVQQERDLQKERESQHVETINALKTEVDGARVSQQELSQIRTENELFASQIIENERELRQSQAALDAALAENARLKEQNRQVSAKEKAEKERKASESADKEGTDLASKISALESRLAAMENERTKRDISLLSSQQSGSDGADGDVEVTLLGPVGNSQGEEKSGDDAKRQADKTVGACGSLIDFCDCFPSTSTVSNNEET